MKNEEFIRYGYSCRLRKELARIDIEISGI
jgi:hypothetical protein